MAASRVLPATPALAAAVAAAADPTCGKVPSGRDHRRVAARRTSLVAVAGVAIKADIPTIAAPLRIDIQGKTDETTGDRIPEREEEGEEEQWEGIWEEETLTGIMGLTMAEDEGEELTPVITTITTEITGDDDRPGMKDGASVIRNCDSWKGYKKKNAKMIFFFFISFRFLIRFVLCSFTNSGLSHV